MNTKKWERCSNRLHRAVRFKTKPYDGVGKCPACEEMERTDAVRVEVERLERQLEWYAVEYPASCKEQIRLWGLLDDEIESCRKVSAEANALKAELVAEKERSAQADAKAAESIRYFQHRMVMAESALKSDLR